MKYDYIELIDKIKKLIKEYDIWFLHKESNDIFNNYDEIFLSMVYLYIYKNIVKTVKITF